MYGSNGRELILIDMDGVLADFDSLFAKLWQERYPEEVYLPIENRTTFYITDHFGPELREKVLNIQREVGFFRALPVIEGSQEAIRLLREYYDVLICTAPLRGSPTCFQEKFDWVCEHFGQELADTMIITKDKTLIQGNFLIDDRPTITGRAKPVWQHMYYHASYNQSVGLDHVRFHSWSDVICFFCT